jgi:hypothetical protein
VLESSGAPQQKRDALGCTSEIETCQMVRPKPIDPRIAKWSRWLETIKSQLYVTAQSRLVFREIFEIIHTNPALPEESLVYEQLGLWYADSVLMGVRRQAKSKPQSISLRRLLEELRDNASIVTRKYWVGLWAGHPLESGADRRFDKFAGKGGAHVDPRMIQSDIDGLQAQLNKCETYVDKRLAHFDKGASPSTPTYRQLDEALLALEKSLQKYYNMVTANAIMSITPTIQFNWKRVFDIPWALPATDPRRSH